MTSKKIGELVTENYGYASVLHYFGIQFYDYEQATLAQVCQQKGINTHQIVRSLEGFSITTISPKQLKSYPIDSLIQFLRDAHDIFTKEKMPYVARIIQDLSIKKTENRQLVNDLQLLFPLFVDDFIHHIHEEENTFFQYILLLYQASKGQYNPAKLFFQMEKNSVQYFALDHNTHDDEMRGIRELTNNYDLSNSNDLHIQVIFSELKSLELALRTHAKIEDEILFVKALQLEKQVKEMLSDKIRLN